eukprot:TRINITY_DN4270_c0_g1_i1.p1 TRINITY_DN4270_c0_g1~~TRINITY_DN4270_c0_g1_i1.p1  ORF type:complete len:231 (-),score=37.80 TRINITY_DN4270_c0_g1_i1:600-1292(-)
MMYRAPSGKRGFRILTPKEQISPATGAPATNPKDVPKPVKIETEKKEVPKEKEKDEEKKPPMDMLCTYSGKSGFDLFVGPKSSCSEDGYEVYRQVLPKNLILKVLERENELLLSEETQTLYSQNYQGDVHVKIIENVQLRALKECGVMDLKTGLIALRSARIIYQSEPELIKQMYKLAMYMRHDISGDCNLQIGDRVPTCRLVSLSNQHKLLSDFQCPGRPLVIIAGSYS